MKTVIGIACVTVLAAAPLWAARPDPGGPLKAAQQVLHEVLSAEKGTTTQQIVQRMAERAGVTVPAMQETLAVVLAGAEAALQGGDTALAQAIATHAATAGVKPASARQLLLGLVQRLRPALAKGQVYQTDRLLETQAKEAHVRPAAARAFLTALVETGSAPASSAAAVGAAAPAGAAASQ